MKIAALILAILFIAIALGYYCLKPKVVVRNQSSFWIEEVIVKLPTNRISVGPLSPGSEQRIFFDRQQSSDLAHYQIKFRSEKVIQGQFHYQAGNEWGNRIGFNILNQDDAQVSF